MKYRIPVIVTLFVLMMSIFSILIVSIYQQLYAIMFLLPLSFILIYIFLLCSVPKQLFSITTLCFLGFAFIRYVLTPLLGSLTEYFSIDKVLVTDESILTALSLMIFELLISAIVLLICELKRKRTNNDLEDSKFYFSGSSFVYIIFVIFTLAVYLVFGRNLDLKISFIILNATEIRTSDSVDTIVSVINILINASVIFITILLLGRYNRKFRQLESIESPNKKYLFRSLLVSMIPVCIIFGERRATVLNVAVGFTMLLSSMYPKYKKKIFKFMAFGTLAILAILTVYKTFYVFLYGSYASALGTADIDMRDLACQLDSYFYGIKTVARNITFASQASLGISNLFYDIFRNIFGFSFFLKESGQTTSELFNLYKSGGREITGTLFSGCGYCYIFFGVIGAPLAISLKLILLSGIEKLILRLRSFEWLYIWAYLYSMLAYFMFGSLVMQLNSFTRFLFCYGFVILCASLVRRRENDNIL